MTMLAILTVLALNLWLLARHLPRLATALAGAEGATRGVVSPARPANPG